jgi:hypothetical protein
LLPKIANDLSPSTGYTFASIAVGGSNPRCWYYMLRAADPTARRYAAVLLPVPEYDDADTQDEFPDSISDLHYLIARLGLKDLVEFSGSFRSFRYRWEAFRGILLKGLVYKRDLQAWLEDPAARFAMVDQFRDYSADWNYSHLGHERALTGLKVDWAARRIEYPPGLPPEVQRTIHEQLLAPPAPKTPGFNAYRRRWFGKILDHYRGSGTRLIVVRVPRIPIVPPERPPVNPHSSVRELASRKDVIVLDEHLFDHLERPEFFMDGLHMNREGLARFSRLLGREVQRVLPPSSTPVGV